MSAVGRQSAIRGSWLQQRRRLLGVAALLAAPLHGALQQLLPGGASLVVPPLQRHRTGHAGVTRRQATAEDDVAGSGPSPEAWRDFRAKLISGGLKLTTEEEEEEEKGEEGAAAPLTSEPEAPAGRRTVAPKNEELLKEQSLTLWNEYMNGAWAHTSPVEAGGLMCRLPLPAQVTYLMREAANGGVSTRWGELMYQRFLEELPKVDGRSQQDLFDSWSRNTNFCFKIAENLISEVLDSIMDKAVGGSLDPSQLTEEERDLLFMYKDSQDTYQQVCLVLRAAESGRAAEAVTINRPLARNMDQRLAELILNGQDPDVEAEFPEHIVEDCALAFGRRAAVYLGGPDDQEKGGILVHRFGELEGAAEISPGTRIYSGGIRDAIEGVLIGKYSPLDFRWFIGKRTDLTTSRGEWNAVACARPIAIKQCLGLPKPLWHEVMELCGGEEAELSRIEFIKHYDDDVDDVTANSDGDDGDEEPSTKASSQDRI